MTDADASALRGWIARAVVSGGFAPLPEGGEPMLPGMAFDEGMTVLLADMLARAGAEAAAVRTRAGFENTHRSMVVHELTRQAEARAVVAALSASGVRSLVLKGTALAYWLYAQPAQRARGDFDLLVEDSAQAVKAGAILQREGYAFDGPTVEQAAGFEVALERTTPGGVVHRIDLHWRLMNNAALVQGFDFEEFWSHSIVIQKLHPQARGLGRVHALVHALLHRVTNFPGGNQNRLIWLYDIHLLADGCSADDWKSFLRVCADKAIAAPCLDGLRASRDAFEGAIPADIEAGLHAMAAVEEWQLDESLDQGAMDRAHLRALPWSEKSGWLWRKLFPSPDFMRYRYGASGAFGMARAYLGRWLVGIRRSLGF